MDNWTRQFYENELKEIYKPEENQSPKKTLVEEIRGEVNLKSIKSGLGKTLKKVLYLFLFVIVGGLLVFGGIYMVLKYFMN